MIKRIVILAVALVGVPLTCAQDKNACCPVIGDTRAGEMVKAISLGDVARVDDMADGDFSLLDQAIAIASAHQGSHEALALTGIKKMKLNNRRLEKRNSKLYNEVRRLEGYIGLAVATAICGGIVVASVGFLHYLDLREAATNAASASAASTPVSQTPQLQVPADVPVVK
jgi:hypothetical protein